MELATKIISITCSLVFGCYGAYHEHLENVEIKKEQQEIQIEQQEIQTEKGYMGELPELGEHEQDNNKESDKEEVEDDG